MKTKEYKTTPKPMYKRKTQPELKTKPNIES